MSLLPMDQNQEFRSLADELFSRQFELDPQLGRELDATARKKMYQNDVYTVGMLCTALALEDGKIFESYAQWFYQLLCPLIPCYTRERIRDLLLDSYALMEECMERVAAPEKGPALKEMLDRASRATAEACERDGKTVEATPRKYEAEIQQYLDSILKADTRNAVFLIPEYVKKGIPLPDVYVDIVGECMREVGELWHRHTIEVDQEHYCTSTTQMALAQLYPVIFSQVRRPKKILVACVGSELHELAGRMVADLFEYNGWDSVYLGAAVPAESILSAVEAHRPDLVALSVTMPQHLPVCKETVERLRSACPDIKIAVGGKAFEWTNEIWKNWRVDVYTQDAKTFVAWAVDTLQ
ncbi:cobalamin-dependent protein [Eubacterium sp. 1001713B170207_170306_E7]|uniref:cobalamin B12-binding domain-containing protein n=1 Tax=Eubacterium sp. 1001713B170207_170306_E7 TaxID=2787097 RepID=UPI001897C672|nr:cobalamin-dependent protein [Eubacterium sp. 1001713B170207_170306_E7]